MEVPAVPIPGDEGNGVVDGERGPDSKKKKCEEGG